MLVRFAVLMIVFAVATLIYWSGLHGGFFFDDRVSILYAQGIRMDSLSLTALRDALFSAQAGPLGRPLTQLSFALNYYFVGLEPFVFKLSNLAIHLANALLIFVLAYQLLVSSTPKAEPRSRTIAAGVLTIAWMLHPIQLLAVLHVVQRATSLSAFFLLAALLLHIKARKPGSSACTSELLLAWGLFWPLSFLCKETGLLFPLFALAWELIPRRAAIGRLDRFAKSFAILIALTLFACSIYALSPKGHWLWAGYELRSFSLSERLLTEGRIIWFYLGLVFFPRQDALGLYHDDLIISSGILTPWTTLPALVGLAGLIGLCWRTRTRYPLVSFGIAWFLVGHLLESTALPLEIAHEHRNYLPLFGLLLALASGLVRALNTHGPIKTLGITLATVTLVFLPFITALRSHQFGEEIRRSELEAQFHPDSARAQYEAGRYLVELTDASNPGAPSYSFARKYFERSVKLDESFKLGYIGLIHLNCTAGIPVKHTWVDELEHRLRTMPFAPGDRSMMYGLKEMSIAGAICLSRPEMERLFAAALANHGVSPGIQGLLLSWLADYFWLREHDLAASQGALKQSLEINPGSPSNRLKWAQLVLLSGEPEKARQLLLELQDAQLSAEERKTRTELLTGFNITGR